MTRIHAIIEDVETAKIDANTVLGVIMNLRNHPQVINDDILSIIITQLSLHCDTLMNVRKNIDVISGKELKTA